MSLYDILACPNCKVRVIRCEDTVHCPQCHQIYPIIQNVPIMFPDGSVPEVQHQAELFTRSSYDPWVHRVILQSLLDDQSVLDVGSGNVTLNDPNIIRMDVKFSPHVDLLADVHALPFLPKSLDFIFSLAVFEHLRNPFLAAQSIYDTLKDGGYIYHECNFVFGYHGYPHHYFNASLHGMEQIFSQFVHLRKGVAPYQMPFFTLDNLLQTYLQHSKCMHYPHGRRLGNLLHQVLEQNSMDFDIYFAEEDALYVAAGTFIAGVKQEMPDSSLIPQPIRLVWETDTDLQNKFPKLNDISTTRNILRWAKEEGRISHPEIAQYLDNLAPFNKLSESKLWDRTTVHQFPYIEPHYGAIGYLHDQTMKEKAQIAESKFHRNSQSEGIPETNPQASEYINVPRTNLLQNSWVTLRRKGLKAFLSKSLLYLGYRLQ